MEAKFAFIKIREYLLQYTRKHANSIKNKVSDNWACALDYAQLLDPLAEALLLGCDTVHMQTWMTLASKCLFLMKFPESVLVYGCRRI